MERGRERGRKSRRGTVGKRERAREGEGEHIMFQ